jgi:hypothetical protein
VDATANRSRVGSCLSPLTWTTPSGWYTPPQKVVSVDEIVPTTGTIAQLDVKVERASIGARTSPTSPKD